MGPRSLTKTMDTGAVWLSVVRPTLIGHPNRAEDPPLQPNRFRLGDKVKCAALHSISLGCRHTCLRTGSFIYHQRHYAAIPMLDYPPASIHLAPRSMATVFGGNLADTTVSTTSPGSTLAGGTEVHLADDTCFDSSCDLIASLIYVSPTQINFLVPDNGLTPPCYNCTPTAYRIVFVRDGQRIDNRADILGGPGRLIIDPFDIADYNVVFQVGYDCLFSYSLSDPASCGLSWSQGKD